MPYCYGIRSSSFRFSHHFTLNLGRGGQVLHVHQGETVCTSRHRKGASLTSLVPLHKRFQSTIRIASRGFFICLCSPAGSARHSFRLLLTGLQRNMECCCHILYGLTRPVPVLPGWFLFVPLLFVFLFQIGC